MCNVDPKRVGHPTTSDPRRFDKVKAGERIRRMRRERKLLLEDLSRLLEQRFNPASPQAISKWERGVTVPSIDHFCDLCDIFGCTLDELVRGTADQPFFGLAPDATQKAARHRGVPGGLFYFTPIQPAMTIRWTSEVPS